LERLINPLFRIAIADLLATMIRNPRTIQSIQFPDSRIDNYLLEGPTLPKT
jgi:hypothetical protein